MHKKFADDLIEAEKAWRTGDHLIYVTYPVVKDDKLFLRALENLHKSLVIIISSILRFEYLYKRIELSKNGGKNLEIFFKKCGKKYGLEIDDCEIIKEIISLGKKHKESSVEFSGKGKAYILDDLGKVEINIDKLKIFLRVIRRLLENTIVNFKNS